MSDEPGPTPHQARGLRLVVDTNVFVSALITPGRRASRLIDQLQPPHRLITSRAIADEFLGAVARPGLTSLLTATPRQLDHVCDLVNDAVIDLALPPALTVRVRDPRDQMVLDTAVAGRADLLVTGDLDLLVLADDPRIAPLRIVTVAAALAELE